jgi:hypothetical protein
MGVNIDAESATNILMRVLFGRLKCEIGTSTDCTFAADVSRHALTEAVGFKIEIKG